MFDLYLFGECIIWSLKSQLNSFLFIIIIYISIYFFGWLCFDISLRAGAWLSIAFVISCSDVSPCTSAAALLKQERQHQDIFYFPRQDRIYLVE